MTATPEAHPRRLPPIKLVALAILLAGAGLWAASGHDLKGIVDQGLEFLRSSGPGMFFAAMALLPALGAPVSIFSLTAGSLFADQLGMPVVALLCMLAITANIALTYLLAIRTLRPLLQWLVPRLGYRLPEISTTGATDVIVLLRVTPGVPFFVQNYLLGIAAVPFRRYLLVSCLVALPVNAAFLVFGAALLEGQGRKALTGLLLVVAAMAAIHLVRRRYAALKQGAC